MVGLRFWFRATSALFLMAAATCRALDNPDVPDEAAAFAHRSQPYEAAVSAGAGGGPGAGPALAAYEQFLESELNSAYRRLRSTLAPRDAEALHLAQKRWLEWRASEWAFSARVYQPQTSGSSFALDRGLSRAEQVKQRVVALLRYRQALPAPNAPKPN